MHPIYIAADPEIPFLDDILPHGSVKLSRFDPSRPLSGQIDGVEALLVRTVSPINRETISRRGTVRVVATASAGIDHVDTNWLEQLGIRFFGAPGSNARSVGEYVATAILIWCDARSLDPSTLSLGIVGCGHTGSAVSGIMETSGMRIIGFDPPRERREPAFRSARLEEVLGCDILTLHVPLTRNGEDATHHWLDREKLDQCKAALVINAARGGVIDESALKKEIQNGKDRDLVLDVWEGEPIADNIMLERAFLASPHIAGYSRQAKLNASFQVCRQIADFFGFGLLPFTLPANDAPGIPTAGSPGNLLMHLHPLRHYNDAMRPLAGKPDTVKARLFARIRNGFPLRDEYPYLRLPNDLILQWPLLRLLGFAASQES